MNLRELNKKFDTQEKCLEFIEASRWPSGVRCVTCGNDKISRVTSSSKKQTVRKLYECLEPTCRQQFTATSGTIMHDTHLPLQTWLMAITLITQAKKGLSAAQLQRTLGLGSYKTAWHLCHRIREAMKETGVLSGGTIEIDEAYVGGVQRGNKGKQKNKAVVIGMRQRGGLLRLVHVPDNKADTVYGVIHKHVGTDVEEIMTDTSPIYNFKLTAHRHAKHSKINHRKGEYVRGSVYTNTIENSFSLLKRGIIGNFHHVSQKHLHRYLSEFETRFNNRNNETLFQDTVARLTKGTVLPLAKLLTK